MKAIKITALLFLTTLFIGCNSPSDFNEIIYGEYRDNKAIYYPSTDHKTSCIIIDKDGSVWYLRVNGVGTLRDRVELFNVNDVK